MTWLAQSLLSFTIRQQLPFEVAPLHGLILLSGAPGTGKTTIARGLANQVAHQLPKTKCTFVEIDPHALASSALGRSQQAMTKLFEQTIPELAMSGAAIVLLDEVETLAVSRHRLSFDANPADVHRAAVYVFDRLSRDLRPSLCAPDGCPEWMHFSIAVKHIIAQLLCPVQTLPDAGVPAIGIFCPPIRVLSTNAG